jgi:type IV secretory pathway TrbD component
MRESHVPGVFHRPKMVGGIESGALGLCWGPFALIAVMVAQSQGWLWACLPLLVGGLVHGLLVWLYAKDPDIFRIYRQYARMADRYHPNLADKLPATFERPHGYGRGVRN